MKKYFIQSVMVVSLMLIGASIANAQTPCSVDGGITNSGLYPNNNYCFTKGVYTEVTWQFKNYDQITALGQTVNVDSIRFDSICNLPLGLKWTTSKQSTDSVHNNKFNKLENGCLFFWGAVNDSAGTYATDLYVTAYVHGLPPIPQHLSTIGTKAFIRVLQSGGACTMPDTSLAACTGGITPSAGHKDTPTYLPNTGITEVVASVSNFVNYPNPFNTSTEIVFNSNENRTGTFKVYDLTGNTLHEEQINMVAGRNTITFMRKGLSSGIYFYSVSDGEQTYTHKMVITE